MTQAYDENVSELVMNWIHGKTMKNITIKELRRLVQSVIAEGPNYRLPPVECTIFLPTDSAIALWTGEILGQLSDGMWENARPFEHWKFWHDLKVEKGPPHVEGGSRPEKNSYNLAALIPILGDRMTKLGRMGSVPGMVSKDPYDWRSAAEHMPATYEDFEARKGIPEYAVKYMDEVSADDAKAYYASRYGDKDMRNDLRSIKAALKSAKTWRDEDRDYLRNSGRDALERRKKQGMP